MAPPSFLLGGVSLCRGRRLLAATTTALLEGPLRLAPVLGSGGERGSARRRLAGRFLGGARRLRLIGAGVFRLFRVLGFLGVLRLGLVALCDLRVRGLVDEGGELLGHQGRLAVVITVVDVADLTARIEDEGGRHRADLPATGEG